MTNQRSFETLRRSSKPAVDLPITAVDAGAIPRTAPVTRPGTVVHRASTAAPTTLAVIALVLVAAGLAVAAVGSARRKVAG